jgi:aspartyl protease family protein
MLFPVLLVALLVVMAALALFGGGDSILGLEPSLLASLTSGLIIAILALGWTSDAYRGRWRQALSAALAWALIFLGFITAYAYRFELEGAANRVLAAVAPGYTVAARGGEVVVTRSRTGSFVVAGRINGRDARFIFDTGASTVVLTEATARQIGIDLARLNFDQPVSTANGRTTAARVRLDRLSIGPISEARVEALVARPGALFENLLGMSFLDRLQSYEVRDDRLILRGGA